MSNVYDEMLENECFKIVDQLKNYTQQFNIIRLLENRYEIKFKTYSFTNEYLIELISESTNPPFIIVLSLDKNNKSKIYYLLYLKASVTKYVDNLIEFENIFNPISKFTYLAKCNTIEELFQAIKLLNNFFLKY